MACFERKPTECRIVQYIWQSFFVSFYNGIMLLCGCLGGQPLNLKRVKAGLSTAGSSSNVCRSNSSPSTH